MKPKFLLFIILFVFSTVNFGQVSKINSGYLSFHGGNYSILSKNYEVLYNTKPGFILGASFAILISSRFTFQGAISYFQKEGEYIPADNFTGQENNILKQLIIDAGLELNLFPQSIIDFYLLSGFTIARIDEERKNLNGGFIYETEGIGNFGIYAGVVGEVNLGKGPISVVSEYRYYYSWNSIFKFDKTYHAQKISVGIRLYFSKRWK